MQPRPPSSRRHSGARHLLPGHTFPRRWPCAPTNLEPPTRGEKVKPGGKAATFGLLRTEMRSVITPFGRISRVPQCWCRAQPPPQTVAASKPLGGTWGLSAQSLLTWKSSLLPPSLLTCAALSQGPIPRPLLSQPGRGDSDFKKSTEGRRRGHGMGMHWARPAPELSLPGSRAPPTAQGTGSPAGCDQGMLVPRSRQLSIGSPGCASQWGCVTVTSSWAASLFGDGNPRAGPPGCFRRQLGAAGRQRVSPRR